MGERPSAKPKARGAMGRRCRVVTRTEAHRFIFTFAYVLLKNKNTPEKKKELGAAESHPGAGEVVKSSMQAGGHENIATGNLLQNRTLS